jgi:NitT/TauT family transport system ATP-binding protein
VPDAPICELRDVSIAFPQPRGVAHRVLENVNLSVNPDEVVALLGPSGCGKSTILRILAGLTRPTGGEVRWHGERLSGLARNLGFVFQGFALFPWMTVIENVEAALVASGLPGTEIAERAARALRLVGLIGAEEAFPRELSGGMKQRVGMARALSLEPEVLFMDEPFSQVDALTAESLRAELLDIWSAKDRHPRSIVLVSHDIKEVAYMADRIVVLDANPGRVRSVEQNALPRPRDLRSPALLAVVDRLHDIITGMAMPDVPLPAGEPAGASEPIPDASPAEIVGLLEWLDARGGREDVFRIGAETHREFGKMIAIVNGAELLELVDTPRRTVVLGPLGQRFVRAGAEERKVIWRERILELGLFRRVAEAIARSERGRIDRELVLEMLAIEQPQEDYEAAFVRLVAWARFGNLFAYDDTAEILTS